MNRVLGIRKTAFLFLLFSFSFQGEDIRGCSGCGCYNTIEKNTEAREINNLKINLTANKVKNTKYVIPKGGRFDFELGPKSNYRVKYTLNIEGYKPIYDLCEHYIKKDDDLNKCLKEFNIMVSDNNQHIAVGIKNKVKSFHHLIAEGQLFSSGLFYFEESIQDRKALDIGEIDWKVFPESASLFNTLLINEKRYVSSEERKHILAVLKELSPGNEHEIFLIRNWYNGIGNNHFSWKRIEKIVKVSPEWKTIAINKTFPYIEQPLKKYKGFKQSLMMLLAINDKTVLHKLDHLFLFENHRKTKNVDYYFYDRMYNKKIPMQTDTKLELVNQSIKVLNNYSDYKSIVSANFAIELLIKKNKHDLVEKFLTSLISNEGFAKHGYSVIQLSIKNYKIYPDNIRSVILSNYSELMKNPSAELNNKNLVEIFKFIDDKIPCESLKPIYNLNKERLKGVNLPAKCKD